MLTMTDGGTFHFRNGAYGFHPFHSGIAYGSFPSGHTAQTLAIAAVVWIVYPRWRWACVIASLAVSVGLLGMNYHFPGDVIAGGFVGGIVGTYTAYCCGFRENLCSLPHAPVPPNLPPQPAGPPRRDQAN